MTPANLIKTGFSRLPRRTPPMISRRFMSSLGPPDNENHRAKFTEWLEEARKNPNLHPKARKDTVYIINLMNDQMVKNNVELKKDHLDVLIKSITNGDCVVELTMKENDFVRQSEGSGYAYNAGRIYHEGLYYTMKYCRQEKE